MYFRSSTCQCISCSLPRSFHYATGWRRPEAAEIGHYGLSWTAPAKSPLAGVQTWGPGHSWLVSFSLQPAIVLWSILTAFRHAQGEICSTSVPCPVRCRLWIAIIPLFNEAREALVRDVQQDDESRSSHELIFGVRWRRSDICWTLWRAVEPTYRRRLAHADASDKRMAGTVHFQHLGNLR